MGRDTNIVSYLERTAAASPDRTAVIHLDQSITFRDLRIRSRQIAAAIAADVSSATRMMIGVYHPKNIEAVCADYGVLYSGNYFLNLDVRAPQHRNKNILDRLRPELILTKQCYVKQLHEIAPDCRLLLTEDIKPGPAPAPESLAWTSVTDADPFCVITTSGSTGTPKGVVLSHRGYIDNLTDTLDATGLRRRVKLASIAPTDFDFFIYEICYIALSGSTMVMIPESYILFPAKLMQYMQSAEIDYIEWIPSFMVSIAQMDLLSKYPLPALREVWYGGEVFPTKHLNYWRRKLPKARFVHFYGPTEASYTCTYKILDQPYADDEPVPIGRPFNNTRLLVLDPCDRPVQGTGEGELCVLGTRLAHGYYNDPEKTKQVFVQNPLNTAYPEIMYRTGDIVSYTEDGELIFRGRADTLIKHNGYRIELSEVEHVINSLGIVSYACAVYDCDLQEITLFYEADEEIPIPKLRMQIGTALPTYMIPTRFVCVDKLPRNTNDKIDRVCLKCMLPCPKDQRVAN